MATAMIYDTLKLADQLEHEAGFDAPRARAMARIMAETAGGNLATREDILLAKTELRAEIQAVKDDLRGEIQAVKDGLRGEIQAVKDDLRGEIHGVRDGLGGEIQGLRGEIQDMKGDIRVLYWISGTTLAGVAAILSIAITVALHVMHLG